MFISPLFNLEIISFLSEAFVEPVNNSTLKPREENHSDNDKWCCSANISVGHIKAVCQPFSCACNALKAPTNVFPEPTSP